MMSSAVLHVHLSVQKKCLSQAYPCNYQLKHLGSLIFQAV